MADPGIAADPNTITDPTGGGSKNFSILDIFQSFGYQPTQAELDALAPAFEGGTNVSQTGTAAVSEYVQAHQALGDAQSKIQGQLLSEQQASTLAQSSSTILEKQGQAAYQQASDIFSQAPKLFGSLTPDQVSQYIAPILAQTQSTLGSIQGGAAARGLAGSNIEAQALSQAQTLFQQNVLQQGLSVGMTQQQAQAQALQATGQALIGASGTAASIGAQYASLANQSAGANANLAEGISGLAGSAVNQSIAQQATIAALNPKSQSFFQKLGSNYENIALQGITNAGTNLVQSFPATQTGNSSGIPAGVTGALGSIGSVFGGGGSSVNGTTPTGAPSSGISPTGAALGAGSSAGSTTFGSDAVGGLAALA